MLKRLTPVVGAMLLTLATYAVAQELNADHPDTYTVKKGDTLWDISAKFLAKPWLWPEIWQANPQVKNPHRIYPGDVLSLHYVNGQPRVAMEGPEVHTGDAVDTVPLSEIEPWLKQLTIVNDPEAFPYVIGMEDDRLRAGSGQLVYVRGMPETAPGTLVQVARPMTLYAMNPPDASGYRTGGGSPLDRRGHMLSESWTFGTWSNGDEPHHAWGQKLGYELMLQSIGEVTRQHGDITVVLLRDEHRDVRKGDRIIPVEDQPYCNCYIPHAARTAPESAQILAVPDGVKFAGPRMVVAISAGLADGIDNGTVFSIWRPGVMVNDDIRHYYPIPAYHDAALLPDEYVGHVMVFRTFDHVSYGLVMDSIKPTRVADFLKHPDAVE